MERRHLIRTSQLAVALLALSGCAHASVHDVAWGPVDGPMCDVRVESDYGAPVEARARAGGLEIDLGVVEPESAHEFAVPCAHRAVTVYRVVSTGLEAENRLDSRAQALHRDGVTLVTLRPSTRRSAGLR